MQAKSYITTHTSSDCVATLRLTVAAGKMHQWKIVWNVKQSLCPRSLLVSEVKLLACGCRTTTWCVFVLLLREKENTVGTHL